MRRPIAFFAALVFLLGLNIAQAEQQLNEATLSIPNMECMSCEMRVEQAVREVAGVAAIDFDGEAKTASIRFDASQGSLEQILAACEEAGYPATVLDSITL